MPHCLVEGCHFRNRKENSCRHFSFPDCEKTCQKWLEQLNRQDYKVTKNSRLCIRHFAPDSFLKPEENFSTKGLIHVIWIERQMLKLVLNVKYLLLLSFLTVAKF